MGAWIETEVDVENNIGGSVAPHVGAWIETTPNVDDWNKYQVAPHVGAWIETFKIPLKSAPKGRAPRGRVD